MGLNKKEAINMNRNILLGITMMLLLTLPAAASDYTLGIFGNANEDDTINMQDVTYTELIILEYRDQTELADAKYDGKINMQDVTQIELVILGRELELTILDSVDRVVTVKKPLQRIVSSHRLAIEMLKTLEVSADRIVGVSSVMQRPGYENDILFPEFQDKPAVGNLWTPDVEAILNLNPDVVMLMAEHMSGSQTLDNAQNVLESVGIPVIRVYGGVWGKNLAEEVEKLGYVFGKQDEAEEFVYFYDGFLNQVRGRVEEISEEDKPEVYLESSKSYSTVAGSSYQDVEAAGGKNIFFEMGGSGSVDPEAVIDLDPGIIVKVAPLSASGYRFGSDDTAEIEKVREEVMSRPELQNVRAVKDGAVYVISCRIVPWGPAAGCRGFLQIAYQAKWFHPELFEDMDPQAIHQEYLTEFQGLDYDLDERGVFVDPPLGEN